MMLKSTSFPLTVPNRTSNLGKDFSLQSLELYSCIQFEIREKIGLLILLNSEAASLTVFTTMCPKEQQTSDNRIIKDYCFIIEILDEGPVKRTCKAGENSSFIFTVRVRSVPRYHFKLAYVILQMLSKNFLKLISKNGDIGRFNL